ncbi:hypothetical protein GGTG_00931 [Gaeumannomyces tritici R3-111a-1]|uniref:Uncharacterized protein n=1 Tax=Gaeumannomyces tritici (strain R3-111a-1) TaxID=644352 RepID=J3NI48_GAET3|nr:hypothetical protein GGTG_00931 [Gaeumannomyces tritici R3-111a-1]EJT80941.1 hypothetical protein GGTG_00931 [Gaeumannomyces tritici R3-111a-1]
MAVNISSPGDDSMGEASTMPALTLSPRFDLTGTYFLTAGIAGVSPKRATTGRSR